MNCSFSAPRPIYLHRHRLLRRLARWQQELRGHFAPGQEPPVNGFWSLTLYNKHHFFHPNDLKRYSLGTKNKNLKRNADGSLTLYAGAKSPGADKESNWLPRARGHFSFYIRAYWGKQGILEGSWKPPVVKAMNQPLLGRIA